MPSDYEFLRQLNIEMGEAEARSAEKFFDELLVPAFATRSSWRSWDSQRRRAPSPLLHPRVLEA